LMHLLPEQSHYVAKDEVARHDEDEDCN